jgi:hypothetical protein
VAINVKRTERKFKRVPTNAPKLRARLCIAAEIVKPALLFASQNYVRMLHCNVIGKPLAITLALPEQREK